MLKKHILSGLGLAVAALLATGTSDCGSSGGGGSSSSSGGSTPTTSKPSTVDLNAKVQFTGTQFVITNNDSFDWTNVKFEINPGIVSSGWTLKHPVIKAGGTYTVGAGQFTKSDGERFSPFTHKPKSLSIWCDTPEGKGFYLGGWE